MSNRAGLLLLPFLLSQPYLSMHLKQAAIITGVEEDARGCSIMECPRGGELAAQKEAASNTNCRLAKGGGVGLSGSSRGQREAGGVGGGGGGGGSGGYLWLTCDKRQHNVDRFREAHLERGHLEPAGRIEIER